MSAEPMPEIVRGNARNLDLPDESVDLVVTSPPYFGLRDYGTTGQLGAEPSPAEYVAALIECTREMVRVLKPSGSIFVNLGDKYAQQSERSRNGAGGHLDSCGHARPDYERPGALARHVKLDNGRVRTKSLMLLPERYRIAAVDELGLIARAVLIWSKPNGLPESVTDRVRRSHEDWVHLTKQPKYFAAVDEIREQYAYGGKGMDYASRKAEGFLGGVEVRGARERDRVQGCNSKAGHPLGRLPGSVWNIPTQPLRVPAELGIDHFAAFPMEWPRRIIAGWCPREVCTVCGEGRRPVVERTGRVVSSRGDALLGGGHDNQHDASRQDNGRQIRAAKGPSFPKHEEVVTGYACACPDTTAPSTPGVVLDPFGGTGTTALVAAMNGRRGISVDLSDDYCRLARWRAQDPKQRAKAAGSAPPVRERAPVAVEDRPLGVTSILGSPDGVETPPPLDGLGASFLVGHDALAHAPTVARPRHDTQGVAS